MGHVYSMGCRHPEQIGWMSEESGARENGALIARYCGTQTNTLVLPLPSNTHPAAII
jgi:hypothetical protein